MSDLSLIPLNDLVEEIYNRFDHVIFCGVRSSGNKNAMASYHFSGDKIVCLGIAGLVQRHITDSMVENQELTDDDSD